MNYAQPFESQVKEEEDNDSILQPGLVGMNKEETGTPEVQIMPDEEDYLALSPISLKCPGLHNDKFGNVHLMSDVGDNLDQDTTPTPITDIKSCRLSAGLRMSTISADILN